MAGNALSTVDSVETTNDRLHGDSYSDVLAEEEPVGTASTHAPRPDRQREEPSESVFAVRGRADEP